MSPRHGFTLVEILAVLAILGIAVALAQVRFARSPAQALDDEARRLALVLELARDEAMMLGCTFAWVSRSDAHRTGCLRTGKESAMHRWPPGIALERVSIAGVPVARDAPLFFTPSGINAPFELVLAMEDKRVLVSADALGRVSISK